MKLHLQSWCGLKHMHPQLKRWIQCFSSKSLVVTSVLFQPRQTCSWILPRNLCHSSDFSQITNFLEFLFQWLRFGPDSRHIQNSKRCLHCTGKNWRRSCKCCMKVRMNLVIKDVDYCRIFEWFPGIIHQRVWQHTYEVIYWPHSLVKYWWLQWISCLLSFIRFEFCRCNNEILLNLKYKTERIAYWVIHQKFQLAW